MNKPTSVAFSTQKGGAGKTTITVLVASYLHYVRGYDVAVVDCDFPQYSIHDMRRRDMDMTMKDDHYKAMAYEQFRRLDKKAYPVLCCKPEDAVATAEKLAGTGRPLNFVFFDLPGTINNPNIVKAIASMDYIFCPIVADRVVMTSSMQFATVINEHMISTGKTSIKGLYMLWNMVDGREKSELYDVYEEVIHELGLSVLKTFLPDSKRFRRELSAGHKALFRSTIFPADKVLVRGSNLNEIIEEILEVIQ